MGFASGLKSIVSGGIKTQGKTAAKAGAKVTAKTQVKTAAKATAKTQVKAAAKTTVKKQVSTIAKTNAKIAAKFAGKQSAADVAKKVAGLAAAGVSAAMAAKTLSDYNRKNGAQFNITSIKQSGSTIIITYDKAETISTNDSITLSNTNCMPNIDGEYTPSKIISPTQLQISPTVKLTTDGTNGKMVLHTTIEQSIADTLNTGTGGLTGGLTDLVDNMKDKVSNFFGDIGTGITSALTYLFIFIIVFAFLAILVKGGPIIYGLFKTSNRNVENYNDYEENYRPIYRPYNRRNIIIQKQ